jgi:hypothetical protein
LISFDIFEFERSMEHPWRKTLVPEGLAFYEKVNNIGAGGFV